jgi:hypothetical protein
MLVAVSALAKSLADRPRNGEVLHHVLLSNPLPIDESIVAGLYLKSTLTPLELLGVHHLLLHR